MSERTSDDPNSYDNHLTGTTYRVYRYMLKQRAPVGISQVQRELALSSPSLAQYHMRKLLQLGLIREEQEGYMVDKVVVDNIVRIRRVMVPVQAAYVTFFGLLLIFLLLFLRPHTISSLFFFALTVNASALGISVYEVTRTMRRL